MLLLAVNVRLRAFIDGLFSVEIEHTDRRFDLPTPVAEDFWNCILAAEDRSVLPPVVVLNFHLYSC